MSSSLILCNNEPFLRLRCATKSRFYTTGNNQLSEWTEKLQRTFQSQICTKMRSWSLFGGLLMVWFTTAFWIPTKPVYLRSMLSNLMRCTKYCNDYSRHWLTEWVQFFSRTRHDCRSYNQRFKSWMNWAMKFCLIHHIHLTSCQPTTTSSNILTSFCPENASSTNRRQKMLFKSLLKHRFSHYRNKQTYFLLAKMCWL